MRRTRSRTQAIQAGSLRRGDVWCGQKVAVVVAEVINAYPATLVYIKGQKRPLELRCNDIVQIARR